MRYWLSLLLLLAVTAHADERILDFHSQVIVHGDGSLLVTETIRVRAEGQQIRRGIYRDFPTDYEDRYGNRYRVGFTLLEVLRDGRSEDYHSERRGNGVRVYIGNAERQLRPGEYSYALSYRTDRQLGFFADHDELYWNVTGNGWNFPIDHAVADIQLPPSLADSALSVEAYTGPAGAAGKNYLAQAGEAAAQFETTRPLGAGEGLTVVVGWPKGHVQEPTAQQQLGHLLGDNRELLAAGGGLLLLALYYLLVWHRVGRDPAAGVIIPHYEPPHGYSPASMRFIRRMGYDHKTFATALVGLAVKGYLRIEETGGEFQLQRLSGAEAPLGPGEQVLLKRLFTGGKVLQLRQSNHQRIRAAIDAHKEALRSNYEKVFFLSNGVYLIPGILLTLATLVGAVLMLPDAESAFAGGFMMVWLSGWTAGVVMLVSRAAGAWRSARAGGSHAAAIAITAFALPFVFFELGGIGALIAFTSLTMVAVLFAAIGLNALFYHLLKAPTRAGRTLLDKLDGFRLYLDVAEKDELQLRHPPQKTPQLFEALLPYAMAFDVEQRWAERFASVLAHSSAGADNYHPLWYSGHHFDAHNVGGFATTLGGALGSAIASSSTAPGSSSGGGGGGSSGGGGGGGGGGGW